MSDIITRIEELKRSHFDIYFKLLESYRRNVMIQAKNEKSSILLSRKNPYTKSVEDIRSKVNAMKLERDRLINEHLSHHLSRFTNDNIRIHHTTKGEMVLTVSSIGYEDNIRNVSETLSTLIGGIIGKLTNLSSELNTCETSVDLSSLDCALSQTYSELEKITRREKNYDEYTRFLIEKVDSSANEKIEAYITNEEYNISVAKEEYMILVERWNGGEGERCKRCNMVCEIDSNYTGDIKYHHTDLSGSSSLHYWCENKTKK